MKNASVTGIEFQCTFSNNYLVSYDKILNNILSQLTNACAVDGAPDSCCHCTHEALIAGRSRAARGLVSVNTGKVTDSIEICHGRWNPRV